MENQIKEISHTLQKTKKSISDMYTHIHYTCTHKHIYTHTPKNKLTTHMYIHTHTPHTTKHKPITHVYTHICVYVHAHTQIK